MRNRSGMLELLFLAPKNMFQLLLSSEIGQFEVRRRIFGDFRSFSIEFPIVGTKGNVRVFRKIELPDIKLIYLGAQEEFVSVLGH